MSEVEEITIKIKKTNNSSVFEMKIVKSASVLELKEKIHEKIGVDSNRQSLVYKGKILIDEKTLADYQVENDHTLILVEKVGTTQTTTSNNTSSSSNTVTSSRPFTMQAGLGTPGTINTDILRHPISGNMDINSAMNLMNNPEVQQAMNEMLNNPEVLNAILENPSIKPMLDANPMMRSMLSNPQLLQTMMNPTFLQSISSMMNTMNSTGSTTGSGIQGFPFSNMGQTMPNNNTTSTTNTTTTSNTQQQPSTSSSTINPNVNNPFMNNPFANPYMLYNPFMNPNNTGGSFNNPFNQNVDPKEKYKEQNLKLKEMGFINDDVNFEVLGKTGGNIDAAVERLLNMLK